MDDIALREKALMSSSVPAGLGLREAAASRSGWMQQALSDLVNCESPSSDAAALRRCAAVLGRLGQEALGRPAEHVVQDGWPHLLWEADRPCPVLVLGHFDTVWPAGTLARWPYTVIDGTASGPGVFDMKAGIVQALAAIPLVDRQGGVTLLLTSDEEVGSASSRALIEEHARTASAVLVCEPSADGGAVKIARKGVAVYQVEVQGRAAHAGLEPHLGVNAGLELAHQLLRFELLSRLDEGTTVTPTVLAGGSTTNTVPERATVSVDTRAWNGQELDRVDREIRRLVPRLEGARIRVSGGVNRYPLETTNTLPLLELLREAANDIGIRQPGAVRSGGASDGNFTGAAGVPTLDGLGAVGAHPHGRDEQVDVRQMPDRAALLAALITRVHQAEDSDIDSAGQVS